MPKWGMSMTEGHINKWLVSDRAEVRAGEEIVEIESDKTVSALEAEVAGVLHQVVGAGATRDVGVVIGVLAQSLLDDDVVRTWLETAPATIEADQVAGRFQGGVVDSTGGPIRYDRAGTGPVPVVLVHGFGGDRTNWLFTMDIADEHYNVYTLDLLGHGGSGKSVGDGSLETLAGALDGALDALGIHRAHLVGHSLGGGVVQALVHHNPQHAVSLTLLDSFGLGPEIDDAYLQDFVTARTGRELKNVLQRLVSRQSLVTREMVESVMRYKRLDGVGAALTAVRTAMVDGGRQRHALAAQTEAAQVPVLVLWGEDDAIIPAAHTAALPSASVLTFPNVGHLPHIESPRAVNREIAAFIAQQA